MLSKMLSPALRALPALALMAGLSTTAALAQNAEGYWQGVQKTGSLRCGAAVAPPYVMRDPASGEYSGFYADLCRELAGGQMSGPRQAFCGKNPEQLVVERHLGARAALASQAALFSRQP